MSDTEAHTYVCSIERFDFILPLIVCEHVLQILAPLSGFLQAKDSDLTEAMKETKAVYTVIQSERNDDLVWDALYASAVEYAATIVEPSSPRCANRQEHRANVPANSIEIVFLAAATYSWLCTLNLLTLVSFLTTELQKCCYISNWGEKMGN